MIGFQTWRYMFLPDGNPADQINQPASVPVATPARSNVTYWITAAVVGALVWKGLK